RRVLRRRRRLPRDRRANDRLHTGSTIPLRNSPRWRNLEARFQAFPRPSCRDGQMPDCDAKGYCRSVEKRALIERIRADAVEKHAYFDCGEPSVSSPRQIDKQSHQPPPPLIFGRCFISSNGTGFSGCCRSGLQSFEAPPGERLMLGYSAIDLLNSITTGQISA